MAANRKRSGPAKNDRQRPQGRQPNAKPPLQTLTRQTSSSLNIFDSKVLFNDENNRFQYYQRVFTHHSVNKCIILKNLYPESAGGVQNQNGMQSSTNIQSGVVNALAVSHVHDSFVQNNYLMMGQLVNESCISKSNMGQNSI